MSGSASGRGGGRGRGRRKPDNMVQPDQAYVNKLKQEQASLANKEPKSPPPPEQTADAESAKTTAGEGKPPPLVEELKETVRAGMQLETAKLAETTLSSTTIPLYKLNPSAPAFTPFDPPTTVSTTTTTTSTASRPMYTKHVPTSSKLDPASREFVPSAPLPPIDPPTSLNGSPGFYGNGDVLPEEDLPGYLDVTTIVRGFERAAPTDSKDTSSEPILKGAAEMLLKVSCYPASFHQLGKNFEATLCNCRPSESTLINLAEMLVHWGVNAPNLRYAACRVSFLVSEMKSAEKFRSLLLRRLQVWHQKCYSKEHITTEDDKYCFANYCGFCAEVFAKFTVEGQPISVIRPFIFKYVEKLLSMNDEYCIREACNILKLTGSNLIGSENYLAHMDKISNTMQSLALDKSLSKTCTSLILQVIELCGARWKSPASPVNPSPLDTKKAATQGLNTNAAPFVPSEPFAFETFYGMPVTQQPVACAADWDDFVGDDQPVEGYEDAVDNEDDYEGLDPEIESEMEAFIEEIEEHLMLQDFDPELHQEKD